MLEGLKRYPGRIMLVISGDDLTASEFMDLVGSDKQWRKEVRKKVAHRLGMPNANHTFSSQQWRSEVEIATLTWVKQCE